MAAWGAPVSRQIVEVEENVRKNWRLVNEDRYGAGWLAKLRRSAGDAHNVKLVTGSAGPETYRAFRERAGIQCGGTL